MNMIDIQKVVKPYITSGGWECDYPLDRVIPFLVEQSKYNKVNYDPDFQRGHVWNQSQQIAWLVHILRGGDSGRRIFFNMAGWQGRHHGTLELVDGKQRIEAIRAFFNDEFPLFDKLASEWCVDKMTKRCFLGLTTVRINVNSLETRSEVLEWYLQMNDGGTPHTFSEIRKVENLLANALSDST